MKKIVFIAILLLSQAGISNAQTVMYSETHTNGQTATTQCNNWNAFRNQLNPGVYLRMIIKGTFDQTGLVCTDRTIVNNMALAIKNASAYISPTANGHVWSVCNRYNGETWVDPPSMCSGSNCPNPGYILRPCITNLNWGGVNTATCGAPTQVMTIIFEAGYPCTDTPKTSLNGPTQVCPKRKFTIKPDSFYADADYKYEFSFNGTTWSNYPGVVDTTTGGITDSITAAKYYRLTVKCRNNSYSWTTPVHKVSIAPFYYCYCETQVRSDAGADVGNLKVINMTSGDTVITTAPLTTGITTPLYNNSEANKVYSTYQDSVAWPCLYRDTTYRFIITQAHTTSSLTSTVAHVYIDLNRDGAYNPNTERVAIKAINGTGNPPEVAQIDYKIPTSAAIGYTGMRIVVSEDTIKLAPCDTLDGQGEIEDYIVEICHRPCDGPVAAGIVSSTDTSMCKDYEYTLTDTTYQKDRSAYNIAWEVSGDNVSWFNVPNSTGKDTLQRIFTGQPLYYRLRTICPATTDTSYSSPTLVNSKPGYKCYCYSKALGGVSADTSDIGGVTIATINTNNGGPHVLNPNAVLPRTDHTDDKPAEMFIDSLYSFYVYHTMKSVEHGDAKITIFMDFDNDHEYDIPNERVYTGFSSIGNYTLIDNVQIPKTVITDVPTGLRVILNNDVGPNVPSDEACGGYTSGETEDFMVIFRNKIPESVGQIQGLSGFGLYPNPTQGIFNVQFNSSSIIDDVNLVITNITGQTVFEEAYKVQTGEFNESINLSSQPAGVYFVELHADGNKLIRKLVIQ